MTEYPNEIWLQVDPEGDHPAQWPDDGVTWCADKINDNDVRYVLASGVDVEVAELMRQIEENRVWWRKFNEERSALRAHINAQNAALKVAQLYLDCGHAHETVSKAIKETPEQSLAEYRAKITKAGEVMRERCIEIADCSAIRTLPAVTLEDLT